jgi:anti-anti-sigma factor
VRRDGVLIFELSGRLGTVRHRLTTAVDAIDQPGRGLILDLANVDYISSAGLLAIDLAAKHLAATDSVLVLCALPEPVRIAFDLAGFPVATIELSRERAIARLAERSDRRV